MPDPTSDRDVVVQGDPCTRICWATPWLTTFAVTNLASSAMPGAVSSPCSRIAITVQITAQGDVGRSFATRPWGRVTDRWRIIITRQCWVNSGFHLDQPISSISSKRSDFRLAIG